MRELKKLSPEAVDQAMAKAERYRLLNEPWLAESICRDILDIEPTNRDALIALILSLTDQFGNSGGIGFDESKGLVERLDSEYDRAYYHGVICERRARVHFDRGHPGAGHLTHEWLERAMAAYEKADDLHPSGNEEARLRWNTCARMLDQHESIRPDPQLTQRESMLE